MRSRRLLVAHGNTLASRHLQTLSAAQAMKRLSRRDNILLMNQADRHTALMFGKTPVMQQTVPPKRKASIRGASGVPLEHEEQVAVIKWWYHYAPTRQLHRLQLIAIPNAQILFRHAKNPHAVLGYLHAEGMRDGAPDLVLFHAVKPWWNGLCLEMKRTIGGKVSADQLEMANILRGAGYKACVCYGADDAIKLITEYCEHGAS